MLRVNPKAQTTVAPVGRSRAADAIIPTTLTSVPHPESLADLDSLAGTLAAVSLLDELDAFFKPRSRDR